MLVLLLFALMPGMAQNSKKVRALKAQKTELQNNLKRSQDELTSTRKKVKTGVRDLNFIGNQMANRLQRIQQMEGDMKQLDEDINRQQTAIASLEHEIQAKRIKLRAAIRYARKQRESSSPLLFVLSARSFTQMYRRARYARDYVSFQRNLGEQILHRQAELLEVQNSLLESKSQMNQTVREVMEQRQKLNVQQVQQKKRVDGLKKQESGLADKVAEQQKQLAALNKKIDQLIAYEIEQARKRAEEEARKKAAAEAAKKKGAASGKTTATAKPSTGTTTPSKPQTWLTPEDRKLNGSFEQNKGRLPVPLTGQYMLGNRFGVYNVPGLNNVQLDNKGTNYVGRKGARARSVFDGVVTAVFQFDGTKNVLVRHGSYISVYCNLSSVIVQKGQKVSARDILGTIADDGSGNCVLHFQLRKETAKLNPELWIGK